MGTVREIASGLQFPEGPVALDDGSVLVGEIARGTLTRVTQDGRLQVVAQCGGGTNGVAIGPDGMAYVCNNGGFTWRRAFVEAWPVPGWVPGELHFPAGQAADYAGGRIQRVDLGTGRVEDLYTECDGHRLKAPNDLVFDAHGGFWFTDHGQTRERDRDRTGVFYAKADGSEIREAIFPLEGPNGIGLSPDGKSLYVVETTTARMWRWAIPEPGRVAIGPGPGPFRGDLVYDPPGLRMWDSLAVEASGNVCIATIIEGGVTVVSPQGERVEHVPMPDPLTTNLCFGGPDLRTAYVTLSGIGKLMAVEWTRPGLRLEHQGKAG
jgi:gluconolactonase